MDFANVARKILGKIFRAFLNFFFNVQYTYLDGKWSRWKGPMLLVSMCTYSKKWNIHFLRKVKCIFCKLGIYASPKSAPLKTRVDWNGWHHRHFFTIMLTQCCMTSLIQIKHCTVQDVATKCQKTVQYIGVKSSTTLLKEPLLLSVTDDWRSSFFFQFTLLHITNGWMIQ